MADSLTFVRVVQVVDHAAGALVVYSTHSYDDRDTIKLKGVGNPAEEYYAQTRELTADDGTRVYAAIFPRLPQGNYDIYYGSSLLSRTTVFAGTVAEYKRR